MSIFKSNGDTFIIAEMSANHGGKLSTAIETIRAAKRAGADAIKLQTYRADTLTIDSQTDDFMISQGTHWDGQYLFNLYKEAALPWEWHEALFKEAKNQGLICFSSPFDKTAVDLLENLNCPIYKIASPEITDIPLIEYVAKLGKPIIFSTGIADENDIQLAIDTCLKENNSQITVLKCITEYPADPKDSNLKTIQDIKDRFQVNAGLSDHSLGIEVPMLSVAMGATVIEKHFILDKNIGGADAHFSLDETEFKKMVDAVRLAEKIIGKVDYELTEKKKRSREFARSLYVVKDIEKGEVISEENVKSIRPGFGLHPKYLKEVLGKKAVRSVEKGTRFGLEMVEN